ncbi:WD repeat-containing protein 43 [Sitophilus oryzae]|uniref:WD repeat-containing protein 43 n=1 Tax=Sitophilus oryzae TaxID=7048 RepID=A0A6J2YJH6_SITOR|nr:WD repeat-containing protein 43 [Sitophilus oryzae]
MDSQFSENGKYFAQISTDGKLKIWNTVSSSFEQEFTPDFHLNTPCTCLQFLPHYQNTVNKGSPSPKKKKRKEDPSLAPSIVLGTTSGLILVYSLSKAGVDYTIDSNTHLQINCLSTVDGSLLYSGADQEILQWNLRKKTLKSKWKGGNELITSILAIPESENILTASKNVKMWNATSKELLRTFTGHSTDISLMKYISPLGGDSYLMTGSKGDRILSCWNITSPSQKTAVSNYLMEDSIHNVAINVSDDGLTNIATTVRTGVVHVYQHRLNGKSGKPLKPKSTIQVACDTGKQNDLVTPIRIFGATFRDSESICIGHGSDVILTFENVNISELKKVYCLVRQSSKSTKVSKEDDAMKRKTPLVGDNVHYLTPQTAGAVIGKRKSEGKMEIPMEQRLENLTINKSEGSSKIPKADNVAQLLLQGLHSKDRNLLRTALCRKDENVIRNTVKRLPVTAFEGLIKELTDFVHGKTLLSHFGALWLKHLAQIHAGLLISNPNLAEMFSGALGSIDNRISLQTSLNRLRGKLELLVPQINTSNADNVDEDEAVLVFNDKDTSDSESEEEMQIEIASDSDENEEWEEEQDKEEEENHVDASDGSGSDSDSVVMLDDEASD